MNATKIIRVDAEVIREIERHWKPRDTPNRVLRRLLGLDKKKKVRRDPRVPTPRQMETYEKAQQGMGIHRDA